MASEYPLKETMRAIRQAGWGRFSSLDVSRNWNLQGSKD